MQDPSETNVQAAYGRMRMDVNHTWMQRASHEVDVVLHLMDVPDGEKLLDVGCGTGRHTLELAQRGYSVTGVDFAEPLLARAQEQQSSEGIDQVDFVHGDARSVQLGGPYMGILCLYDVVGSFPERVSNQAILDNLSQHLAPGGKLVLSVMNMELTASLAKHRADVTRDPAALQRLAPSKSMHANGKVFDPEHFLLDTVSGVVYRKEQFDGDGQPPSEMIVRDIRYTRAEITAMCERAGLIVNLARPVALGAWDKEIDALDKKAKEILVVAEKPRR